MIFKFSFIQLSYLESITESAELNAFSGDVGGCEARVTSPAVLRTPARGRPLVLQVRTVRFVVTQRGGRGQGHAAKTRGARGRLVRHVATLRHAVAPLALPQTQVIVAFPRPCWTHALSGVRGQSGAH